MKIIFQILVIMIISTSLYCRENGFAFLKLPVDAKSIALGRTYSAIPDDANSVYYNQAGLAFLNNYQIAFNSTNFFKDINILNLMLALKGEIYNYGFGIRNLNTVSIDRTEIQGQEPITNIGQADYYDRQFIAAVSRKLNSSSGIGGAISLIQEKIDNINKTVIGIDLGYKKYFDKNLIYGVSIKNIGRSVKFEKEKINLPLMITSGIYYKYDYFPAIAADLTYEVNEEFYYSAGIIINFEKYFSIYFGGSNKNNIKNSINIGFSAFYDKYEFSYAYQNFDEYGDLHSINLSIKFAAPKKIVEEIKEEPKPLQIDETKLYYEYLQLGESYSEDKKYEKSIFYFEKAIKIKDDDKNIGVYKKLGDLNYMIKNFDEAKKYYDIYLEKLKKTNIK